MAQKVIAIKIDVQGTADQKKKIVGLELTLKKLTDQQKRLKKQVKDGVITNDQYAKSIAKVNLGLKGTRRQLLVTRQEMLNIDGFTTRLGKSFKKFGTQVSGAFVGLFAAQKLFQIMSDGVQTIKDFEQQMATVKAITGATTEEFNKLEKSAKDLGSSTQFTASQVGKLQEEYAKLGFNTQEILDASEATLDLATATGSDLAQSAKVAAATINGFGLEAKDTQKIVDIMAKSFTNSALDISKFETAMASVGPVAATVGFSIEQTTASLGTLTDAGFDASTAGTALRNILLDTQKAGLTTSEAFEKIRNSLDPAATALDLFGKRGAAVSITLANNEEKTKAFATSLENAAGSAKQMAAVVGDTLEGDIKRLTSAFEGLILGSSGVDFFRDITQGATDLLNTLSDLTSNTHEERDALEEQRTSLFRLEFKLKDVNTTQEDRVKIIKDLQKQYPKLLGNIDAEKISAEKLSKALKKVNDELLNKIIIASKDEEIEEQNEKRKDAFLEQFEAENEAINLASKLKKKFQDLGISVEATPEGLDGLQQVKHTMDALNKARDRQNQLRVEGNASYKLQTGTLSKLAKQLAALKNRYAILKESEDDFNIENAKSNKLLSEKEKLMKRLGISNEKEAKSKEDVNSKTKKEAEAEAERVKEILELENKRKLKAEELAKANLKEKKEAERESKREADRLKREAKREAEILESENERKLKAEENFLSKVDKLKKSSSLLAIENEKKLQLEKLKLQKEGLEAEAKLKLSKGDKLDNALLSLTNTFNLKEEEINKSFDKKDKAKEKAKKQEKIDDIINVGQFALNSSSVLIDSIANIELQKEKEKLKNKIITEDQFAVLKYNIEKKAFERQKKVDIIQAIMNGAVGVTKAFAQSGVLGAITGGIVAASTAVQVAAISKQKYPSSFADGGFTGNGSGIADETGFKQAGIVHEGEYVVPKHVIGTSEGSSLVGALENMRTNKPMPNLGIGYANGGMVSSGNLDLQGLENRMTKAISNSLSSIQVTNVATETTSQAIKVNNIEQEASFG